MVKIVFANDQYKTIKSVLARRVYLEQDNPVCERCGQSTEEGLQYVTTGRCTRSDPGGDKKCLCLCGDCAENRGAAYGECFND